MEIDEEVFDEEDLGGDDDDDDEEEMEVMVERLRLELEAVELALTEWDPEDRFICQYLLMKPTGDREMWNEDIGFPPFVLREIWARFKEGGGDPKGRYSEKHLLWLLNWARCHTGWRSKAGEWKAKKTTFRRRVIGFLKEMMATLGMVRIPTA